MFLEIIRYFDFDWIPYFEPKQRQALVDAEQSLTVALLATEVRFARFPFDGWVVGTWVSYPDSEESE